MTNSSAGETYRTHLKALNPDVVRSHQQSVFDKFSTECYIDNPTSMDVLYLAPYLSLQGAENVYREALEKGRSVFYGSPCRVFGAYHAYVLTHTRYFDTEPFRTRLGWLGAGRDPNSFMSSNPPDERTREQFGTQFDIHRVTLEMINELASQVCHPYMVRDTWGDVRKFVIADPRKRDKHHDLKPIYTAVAMLREQDQEERDSVFWGTFSDKEYVPGLQRLEAAICKVETGRFSMAEVLGGRPHFTAYHCAICGGGLYTANCSFCGVPIRARVAHRTPTLGPLPLRIAAASGHNFAIHPLRGIKRYYARWATNGLHSGDAKNDLTPKPPEDHKPSSYDRVIDLGTNK
jgi:hypothetical protein